MNHWRNDVLKDGDSFSPVSSTYPPLAFFRSPPLRSSSTRGTGRYLWKLLELCVRSDDVFWGYFAQVLYHLATDGCELWNFQFWKSNIPFSTNDFESAPLSHQYQRECILE